MMWITQTPAFKFKCFESSYINFRQTIYEPALESYEYSTNVFDHMKIIETFIQNKNGVFNFWLDNKF